MLSIHVWLAPCFWTCCEGGNVAEEAVQSMAVKKQREGRGREDGKEGGREGKGEKERENMDLLAFFSVLYSI